MRTNIELDDELVAKAMRILGLTTKRATVEEALRRVINREAKRQALDELWGMGWEGDLDAMRGPYADELEENKEYFEKHKDELDKAKAFFKK
jgi:Arc/MetJ family transcription regulator